MSEQPSALRGVEVFSSGEHRGKVYAERDLDAMVENFRRNSSGANPRLRVPAVLGHDEDQVTLRGSGLPAAAWCSRLWREGDRLKADFQDVPPQVMRLLRGRAYRKVSAEVYDEPPAGLRGKGKTLRRVAFLGGDIPQIKNLEDIPVPDAMSEQFDGGPPVRVKFRDWKRMPDGAFACFSEVVGGPGMNRDEVLALLQQHGMDVSQVTEAVPDSVLMEIVRICDAAKAGQQQQPQMPGQQTPGMPGQPMPQQMQQPGQPMTPGVPPEQMQADPQQMLPTPSDPQQPPGPPPHPDDEPDMHDDDNDEDDLPEPADDDEKAKFAERAFKMARRARKFWEKYRPGQKFGEGLDDLKDLAAISDKDTKGPDKMSEKTIQALVQKAVENALAGKVQGEIGRLSKFAEEQLASQKRLTIDAFCEAQLKAGHILPFELDPASPTNLKARLYRANAKDVVSKFSEGGKEVALTELDLQMREIAARRPFKFGEVIRGGTPGQQADDGEAEKVERFSENPNFGRALEAAGKTPQEWVKGFQELRKVKPGLTAQEYGVPAGAV